MLVIEEITIWLYQCFVLFKYLWCWQFELCIKSRKLNFEVMWGNCFDKFIATITIKFGADVMHAQCPLPVRGTTYRHGWLTMDNLTCIECCNTQRHNTWRGFLTRTWQDSLYLCTWHGIHPVTGPLPRLLYMYYKSQFIMLASDYNQYPDAVSWHDAYKVPYTTDLGDCCIYAVIQPVDTTSWCNPLGVLSTLQTLWGAAITAASPHRCSVMWSFGASSLLCHNQLVNRYPGYRLE